VTYNQDFKVMLIQRQITQKDLQDRAIYTMVDQ